MSCWTQDKIYLFVRDSSNVNEAIRAFFGLLDNLNGERNLFGELKSMEVKPDRNRYRTVRNARLDTDHYRVLFHFEWDYSDSEMVTDAVKAFVAQYPQYGIEHYIHVIEEDYAYWTGLDAQWRQQDYGNGREWVDALLDKAHDTLEVSNHG